jgi:G8 domain/Right handed beta helix region
VDNCIRKEPPLKFLIIRAVKGFWIPMLGVLIACGQPTSTIPISLPSAANADAKPKVIATSQESGKVFLPISESLPGTASVPNQLVVLEQAAVTNTVVQGTAQSSLNVNTPVQTQTGLRWSDPKTWGGIKPITGAAVRIPKNQKILLDESTPSLGGLTIDGELEFEQSKSITLTAQYIQINGSMRAGSAANPYDGKIEITLTAADTTESIGGMGTRGIFVNEGTLQLYGKAPSTLYTAVSDHIAAGSQKLTLIKTTDWKAGDQIIVSPTDYYGISKTERFAISQMLGNVVSINQPTTTAKWGKLQYVTSTGMSLTPEPGFAPKTAGTPSVLDERAIVANLSRNIIIQGANDSVWLNEGFGGQVMIMGSISNTAISGVELRRMGQSGKKGRYPIHFHQLSYDVAGNPIAATGIRYIANNAIWDSKNRCITLHGTSDAVLDNNTCYDIAGHAIFLEDGVERRNQIVNNLVMKTNFPKIPILDSDTDLFTRGPSGFWLSHPDNIVRGNRASDAAGNGFWLAYGNITLGINKTAKNPNNSAIIPSRSKLGVFEDNVAHSNNKIGIMLDNSAINDLGQTNAEPYTPTSDEGPDRYGDNRIGFKMARMTSYKNREAGFWNRMNGAQYDSWTIADNVGVFVSGSGIGYIKKSLAVGVSLNNANTWAAVSTTDPAVAFASYHSSVDIADNTIVNFAYVPGLPGGAFKATDYYIDGIDRGLVRNTNNQLIKSHPGYRYRVPAKDNFTLAGALWDANGYWGPAGNYWTYDDPFLTAGANCTPVASPGEPTGSSGMSCDGEYFGVSSYWTEQSGQFFPYMPIKVSRFASDGSVVGKWEVGDGWKAPMLGQMRFFAVRRGGKYLLEFPTVGTVQQLIPAEFLEFKITNAYRANDTFVMGVPFSGATNPTVQLYNVKGRVTLTSTTSLAAVEASENLFWHDKLNNTVWIKFKTPNGDEYQNPLTPDQNLYRYYEVRIAK